MGKQRTHINAKHGGGRGQVQFVQHVRTRPKSQKQHTEGGGFYLFIVAIFLTSFIACTLRSYEFKYYHSIPAWIRKY